MNRRAARRHGVEGDLRFECGRFVVRFERNKLRLKQNGFAQRNDRPGALCHPANVITSATGLPVWSPLASCWLSSKRAQRLLEPAADEGEMGVRKSRTIPLNPECSHQDAESSMMMRRRT